MRAPARRHDTRSYGRSTRRSRANGRPRQEGAGELFLSDEDPEGLDDDDDPSDFDGADDDGVESEGEDPPLEAPPPEPESDEPEDAEGDLAPDFAASRLSFL